MTGSPPGRQSQDGMHGPSVLTTGFLEFSLAEAAVLPSGSFDSFLTADKARFSAKRLNVSCWAWYRACIMIRRRSVDASFPISSLNTSLV